jgi:hypothetical protein
MHNNKNKSNNSRGLTLDERAFYMLQSIEGRQQIIDECWMVIKNPQEKVDRKLMALEFVI